MIVFDLHCDNDHEFEGWFANGQAFEKQAKAGKVLCPVCNSNKVSKSLSAPAISGTRKDDGGPAAESNPRGDTATYLEALRALRSQVERNCDYVGSRFAEEARKIHYGEAEKRGIYGEASESEVKSLKEEGVGCQAIPWLPDPDA